MTNYHNKVQISYWGKLCKCHCSKIDTCILPTNKGTVKVIKRDKNRTKCGSCRYFDKLQVIFMMIVAIR